MVCSYIGVFISLTETSGNRGRVDAKNIQTVYVAWTERLKRDETTTKSTLIKLILKLNLIQYFQVDAIYNTSDVFASIIAHMDGSQYWKNHTHRYQWHRPIHVFTSLAQPVCWSVCGSVVVVVVIVAVAVAIAFLEKFRLFRFFLLLAVENMHGPWLLCRKQYIPHI